MNGEAITKRYEVRDAETGEKLSGVSFILTPSGEEMHRLFDHDMDISTPDGLYLANIYYTQPENPTPRHHEFVLDAIHYVGASRLINGVSTRHLKHLRDQIDRRMKREAEADDAVCHEFEIEGGDSE